MCFCVLPERRVPRDDASGVMRESARALIPTDASVSNDIEGVHLS